MTWLSSWPRRAKPCRAHKRTALAIDTTPSFAICLRDAVHLSSCSLTGCRSPRTSCINKSASCWAFWWKLVAAWARASACRSFHLVIADRTNVPVLTFGPGLAKRTQYLHSTPSSLAEYFIHGESSTVSTVEGGLDQTAVHAHLFLWTNWKLDLMQVDIKYTYIWLWIYL